MNILLSYTSSIMHPIVTTPGFVIGTYNRDDADKIIRIFTRDMGMIWVRAQGIRLEKSKLRYYTSEYSFGQYAFVRGKDFWRLTGATTYFGPIAHNKDMQSEVSIVYLESYARIANLLKRLIIDEGPHPEVFGHLEKYIQFINHNYSVPAESLSVLEILITARILYALGYIGKTYESDTLLETNEINIDMLNKTNEFRSALSEHISKGLRDSHL